MMFNAQTEGGGWHGNGGMAGLELWNLCLTENNQIKTFSPFFAISPTTENMHGVLKNLTNLILY